MYPTLKVKAAALQVFRYTGNSSDTAILSFELDNGMKFEAPADMDSRTQTFRIEGDGGGYSVFEAPLGNQIVLLDIRPARINLLATPDQLREIEAKSKLIFEGGTGSLTVKAGQSALFVPIACQ